MPDFDLHLDYIPGVMKEKVYSLPVLDISVVNKKWRLGFSKEDVLFGLIIPVDFIENKELFLVTSKGKEKWNVDTRGKQIFSINEKNHYLYRGVAHLAVHPHSRTHFLRIQGNFSRKETVRIYYYFETPFGRFPNYLKLGERKKNIESGNLPSSKVFITPDSLTPNPSR